MYSHVLDFTRQLILNVTAGSIVLLLKVPDVPAAEPEPFEYPPYCSVVSEYAVTPGETRDPFIHFA